MFSKLLIRGRRAKMGITDIVVVRNPKDFVSAITDALPIYRAESPREARDTDWYASDEAIEKYFDLA